MTTTAEKQIMTAERFAQGLTWQDWLRSAKANKEKIQQNYNDFQPKPEEVEFFKAYAARKGLHVVAIGEDWCGDVVRGFPVMARLAEAAGLDWRIFPRDANLDLMNEYLWRHQYLSIPVFVFFDKDWKELGHWIERPAIGYKYVADLQEELKKSNKSEEEIAAIMRERRAAAQEEWMHETLREIREQVLYRVM